MKQELTITARLTICILGILFFVLFGMAINAKNSVTLEPSAQEFTAEMATEMLAD